MEGGVKGWTWEEDVGLKGERCRAGDWWVEGGVEGWRWMGGGRCRWPGSG